MAKKKIKPRRSIGTKSVVLLGAGASAADGAPVQSNLFRGFFESRPLAGGRNTHARKVQRELADYFDSMWGVDVDAADLSNASFPTFEEALGLLELAEARNEFFKGFGGRDHSATRGRELCSHLLSLIAIYLEEKLRTGAHHHTDFVHKLKISGDLSRIAIISLNYDILIDNALLRESGPMGIDYGTRFSSGLPCADVNAVPLLKLHGSLNWLHCPTCNALDYFPGEKIVSHLCDDGHIAQCGRCQQSRVPILIPPTFFKVMSNFYLQEIWHRAEAELRQAREIIFCGYSFPDADLHIKYLLKRAELNRNGRPPKVFILNEHAGKNDEARRLEKDRYLRFFREKSDVVWLQGGFQDFANDPTIINDVSRWKTLQ